LKDVELKLEFLTRDNQLTIPNSYMSGDLDVFSAAVRTISLNLTTLHLHASHLSAELFWPQRHDQNSSIPPPPPRWPNLVELKVVTSIECAQGQYILLDADESVPRPDISVDSPMADAFSDADIELGYTWQHMTRIRPDHGLFNSLSGAMARAMTQMPRLRRFLYKTEGLPIESVDGGSGFGVSCRHDGGVGTRVDWVFACNEAQLLGWRMPDEAVDLLWRRWGGGLSVAYITNETVDERGWVRKCNGGHDEEEWMLLRFFEEYDDYGGWE
jgi:hypothetical protein